MINANEVGFTLFGDDMQFVEVCLEKGESILAEAGAMMYMDEAIKMETILGDGSEKDNDKGMMSKILGHGKRMLTGEGLFMTVFSNPMQTEAKISFAAPIPGKIIVVDLSEMNGVLICQKEAFLCAAKGVSIDLYLQKKIGTGFFGGEGFIMQKLRGDGMVFLHAGGTIIKKQISKDQTLKIDTGCLVAMSEGIDFDIQFTGDLKSGLFGGEGFFLGTLRGEGEVWLQSLPFSRMANKIIDAANGNKGESKNGSSNGIEELAGLANLFGRN